MSHDVVTYFEEVAMKLQKLIFAVAVAATLVQPALAGGGHRHQHGRGGNGWGWAPFVAGAVVGGLAINAWAQPRPHYPAAVYLGPPPPRVVVAQPYYGPPPVYAVPAAPPIYYYERD